MKKMRKSEEEVKKLKEVSIRLVETVGTPLKRILI